MRRPRASASFSAGLKTRRVKPPCRTALGNRLGSRSRHLKVTVEPNERPTRKTRPKFRCSISPNTSSTRCVVPDRTQVSTVIAMFAGVVVEDGAEPRGQGVEQEGVDAIGRGDAGDQDQRGALAQDPVGHPVSRPVPLADVGVAIVIGHRGPEIGRGRTGRADGVAWRRLRYRRGSQSWGVVSKARLAKLTQQVRRSSTACSYFRSRPRAGPMVCRSV